MKRYHVWLSVPAEDEEDDPSRWDWRTLLDTPRPAEVLGVDEVSLLPQDLDFEED